MKTIIQRLYPLTTAFLGLAYFAAALNWFIDPFGTAEMSGVPFTSNELALFYGQIKGVQDIMVPLLLFTFLFTRNVQGVFVSLCVAFLVPLTDTIFAYQAVGNWDSAMWIHVVYLVLTGIVTLIAFLHWRTTIPDGLNGRKVG